MRLGGFPNRAAQVLSLLLYSPGSHGGHIKWPPARAELATNLTPAPPGPGIRRARRDNATCQKGTGLFWSVLSWETSRFNGDLLSPVAWKSAALSEVCGKFWTCRAHRGFAIINPQVERLSICGVVDPSRFCRILQKFRRISLKITVHITQNRPLPLLGSGLDLTNRRWQRVLLFRSLLLMCISCPQGLPRPLDRH